MNCNTMYLSASLIFQYFSLSFFLSSPFSDFSLFLFSSLFHLSLISSAYVFSLSFAVCPFGSVSLSPSVRDSLSLSFILLPLCLSLLICLIVSLFHFLSMTVSVPISFSLSFVFVSHCFFFSFTPLCLFSFTPQSVRLSTSVPIVLTGSLSLNLQCVSLSVYLSNVFLPFTP